MDKQDQVSATHPDYSKSRPQREMFSDILAGTLTLRAKRSKYLPQFPAETQADYQFRADTATSFNLTAKTVEVMAGLVFKEPIKLLSDVYDPIAELWENIDNAGTHGDVFARKAFEATFDGYAAILVDSPETAAATRGQAQRLGLRPYWTLYKADQIINWQHRINPISRRKELALIVFREVTNEATGEYITEQVVRYRVFRLMDGTADGIYRPALVMFQLWREIEDNKQIKYVLEQERTIPGLTEIPVAVLGQLGGVPPLMDLSLKNLEMFQTYSDYKTLIHKTCVPIAVAKGLETGGDNTVVISPSTLVQTSPDGDFGFSEVSGSSLAVIRQAIQDNRDDIALLGLSLLADKTARVDLTATEALLNSIGETAALRVMARNLQDGLELALGHTAEFMTQPRTTGGSIELGTAWNIQKDEFAMSLDELNQRADIVNKLSGVLSPQQLLKLIGVTNEDEINEILEQLRQANAISFEEIEPELPALPANEDNVEDLD